MTKVTRHKKIRLFVERVDERYRMTYAGGNFPFVINNDMCRVGFERATGIKLKNNRGKYFMLTPTSVRRKRVR